MVTYNLTKFTKTNQNTVDLKPIVSKGERLIKGQILTEGYATDKGELAFGRNLKVLLCHGKVITTRMQL